MFAFQGHRRAAGLLAVLSLVGCTSTNAAEDTEEQLAEVSAAPAERLYSFDELEAEVFSQPRSDLPRYEGATTTETLKLIAFGMSHVSDVIVHANQRILTRSDDVSRDGLKPGAGVKFFHPMGICASGKWRIEEGSGYTGVFERGAELPALVRISTGGNETNAGGGAVKRVPALAIKLFPAPSSATRAPTINILTFDRFGFAGSSEPSIVASRGARSDASNEQFFANWVFGEGLSGAPSRGFARFFEQVVQTTLGVTDFNGRFASVNHAAARRADGSPVASPRAPRFVKLVPSIESGAAIESIPIDFREELRARGPLSFAIQLVDGSEATVASDASAPVGHLALDALVVSDFCDKALRFHHDPRQ